MKNIVFLTTGFDYAGAEAQVVELAAGFKKRGWKPRIISMTKPTAYMDELGKLGIDLLSLEMEKGVPDLRGIWKLKRLLNAFKPDIVHSHMVHANLLARITRIITEIPVLISTAHNINEGGHIRMLLYRWTDFLCDYMTNVSQEAVNRYARIKASPRDKIEFIPNGINLKRFNKMENSERNAIRRELKVENDFTWLTVGRMVKAKDYTSMITAWSQVLNHCDGQLLIVGEGPDKPLIESLAHSLGVDRHIQFLGIRTDIPQLMNAADAYLMSSLWEGMPIVLLEAAASELPIVATDIGGNREVVIDRTSGLLARPAEPADLAERMSAMMALSPEERDQMGQSGRRYVLDKYDIETVMDRWESVYHKLLNRRYISV